MACIEKIPSGLNGPIKKQCGIYKIRNVKTGNFIIGSSYYIRRRQLEHLRALRGNKHPNRYLQRAWNKYGERAFVFEVVEEYSREMLLLKETEWIDNTWDINYNINPSAVSPRLGTKASAETRAKQSEAHKGWCPRPPWTKAQRLAKSLQVSGTKHSEETKQKMSKIRRGRKESKKARKNRLASMRTPEYRDKLSKNVTELWQNTEFRAKMKAAVLRRQQREQ